MKHNLYKIERKSYIIKISYLFFLTSIAVFMAYKWITYFGSNGGVLILVWLIDSTARVGIKDEKRIDHVKYCKMFKIKSGFNNLFTFYSKLASLKK